MTHKMPMTQADSALQSELPSKREEHPVGGREVEDGIDERKKRLRFTATWNILMFKAVSQAGAHTAPHDESPTRFKEACSMFAEAASSGSLQSFLSVIWKSISDGFKKVFVDHRDEQKRNVVAYGLVEMRGEREELPNDFALDVNEHE